MTLKLIEKVESLLCSLLSLTELMSQVLFHCSTTDSLRRMPQTE